MPDILSLGIDNLALDAAAGPVVVEAQTELPVRALPVLAAAAMRQKPSMAHRPWHPAVAVIPAPPCSRSRLEVEADGAFVTVLSTFRTEGVDNALVGGIAAAAASACGLAPSPQSSDRCFDARRHGSPRGGAPRNHKHPGMFAPALRERAFARVFEQHSS